MASEQMTLREVCLAERYEEEMTAKDKRIAELEAALRLILSICASKCEPHHNVAAIDHHAMIALGESS